LDASEPHAARSMDVGDHLAGGPPHCSNDAYVQLIHTVADVVGVGLPAFPIVLDSIDVYISLDGGSYLDISGARL
jgi:hypothetical protein